MTRTGRPPGEEPGLPRPGPLLERHRTLLAAAAAAPRRRRRLRPRGLLLPGAALVGGVAALAALWLGGGDAARAPADLRDELIPLGVEAPPAPDGPRPAPRTRSFRAPDPGGPTAAKARERSRTGEEPAAPAAGDGAEEAPREKRVPAPGLALTAPAGAEPKVANGKGAAEGDSAAGDSQPGVRQESGGRPLL